jgi:hypothetical protein
VIAGHFGLAAAVKAKERETPLWALMLATQWLDVVFVPLFVLGVERIEAVPGAPGYGGGVIYADYTHSLLGAAVLAAVFGAGCSLAYGRCSGVVLGAVALSHWALDLVVHRADLPLLPGNAAGLPRLGFGLWRAPVVCALVELALVVGGSLAYLRAAAAVVRDGGVPRSRASTAFVVVLFSGLVTLGLNVAGF